MCFSPDPAMATHECHGMDRQIPAAMEPAKQKYKVQSFHYTVVVKQSLAGAKNWEYIY